MKQFLVAITTLLLGVNCSFAGDVADTIITRLGFHKGIADILFIAVDKPRNNPPACGPNGGSWAFVLPLATDQDKKIYATLLAARASQTPVQLAGTGTCDVFGTIESLQVAFY